MMRSVLKHLAALVATLVLVVLIAPRAALAARGTYVYDDKSILDDTTFTDLENQGARLADTYKMGVYFYTCSDMGSSNPSERERDDFSIAFFKQQGLGVGEGQDGILFVIAVDSRDYDTIKHIGPGSPDPFSNSCVDELEDEVTDHLHDDDWSGGAKAYYDIVEDQLAYYAKNGKPWRRPSFLALAVKILASIGVPLMIASASTTSKRNAMKTARMQTEASAYQGEAGLRLTQSYDNFVRSATTVTRRHEESSGSGGGWHSSGGGFSGSGGGKF